MNCPFCRVTEERLVMMNTNAIALRDGYPVSDGHCLIIPRRHVVSVFDLDDGELADIWKLIVEIRKQLLEMPGVKAVNIGVNDGYAAGQTVGHAHVHLIPRRDGDVEDPRGGIRWVIPDKAVYWETEAGV